ncbi:hypothetical protein SAICODRAFT_7536 [Saitoella complicata NRRL Y-17804]|uniref:uncharacterized protein n=1 Tax=Saitoella complicata (strain BCRC 22490 / CBS 7301 / JCM 7358 / NBRC 10748 / NRRL Y-17804) TaxID=698492 RepID=UPI0008677402|nr:uncharacterized protein SAICODRAFT_7536 [Saitoella complicata NRRL Y-17804]ODQ52934.1 hypothetical protein SAICODRAFT_7536 [Saitoella complicata NRRL Y-17804]
MATTRIFARRGLPSLPELGTVLEDDAISQSSITSSQSSVSSSYQQALTSVSSFTSPIAKVYVAEEQQSQQAQEDQESIIYKEPEEEAWRDHDEAPARLGLTCECGCPEEELCRSSLDLGYTGLDLDQTGAGWEYINYFAHSDLSPSEDPLYEIMAHSTPKVTESHGSEIALDAEAFASVTSLPLSVASASSDATTASGKKVKKGAEIFRKVFSARTLRLRKKSSVPALKEVLDQPISPLHPPPNLPHIMALTLDEDDSLSSTPLERVDSEYWDSPAMIAHPTTPPLPDLIIEQVSVPMATVSVPSSSVPATPTMITSAEMEALLFDSPTSSSSLAPPISSPAPSPSPASSMIFSEASSSILLSGPVKAAPLSLDEMVANMRLEDAAFAATERKLVESGWSTAQEISDVRRRRESARRSWDAKIRVAQDDAAHFESG